MRANVVVRNFLLFCFLFLFSCSEAGLVEPVPPVVIPPVKYKVDIDGGNNATVSPGGKLEVLKGATLDLVITAKSGYKLDSISINGNLFPLVSTNYTISNISNDYLIKIISKKEVVIVTPTAIDTLCLKPWKYISNRSKKLDGSGWTEWNISSEELANSLVFYVNGNYKEFHVDGAEFSGGTYTVSGNVLKFGGLEYKFTVSDKTLITVYKSTSYSSQKDENGQYIILGIVDDEKTYTH
jgi:hypothetical protein